MKEARLLGRALDQLGEQIRSVRGRAAGGLLIGRVEGEVAWIEKALRCPNVAPEDDALFQIAPQALVNVQATLRGQAAVVLGSYEIAARTAPGDAPAPASPPGVVGPLRLLALAEDPEAPPRVWLAEGLDAAREIPVQVVRPAARRVAVCPD